MPDVLLTDIDGTIVDSNALHAEAWRNGGHTTDFTINVDGGKTRIGTGFVSTIYMGYFCLPACDRTL